MVKSHLRIICSVGVVVLTTSLSACGVAPQEPYAYSVDAYPSHVRPSYVEFGRVSRIEVFRTDERNPSGAGALIGGVIGAVVGNQVGGGTGRGLATAAGAVGGALVGNHVEGNNRRDVRETYSVSIEIDNGRYRAYDVPSPGDLRVGDRVRIQDGQISRI